jgi:hypothetical protein
MQRLGKRCLILIQAILKLLFATSKNTYFNVGCKITINKDELRLAKMFPSERFEEGGSATNYFHASCAVSDFIPGAQVATCFTHCCALTFRLGCMFDHLKRVRKTTRKIESVDDIDGYALLEDSDKALLKDLVAHRNDPAPKKPRAPKSPKVVAPSGPLAPRTLLFYLLHAVCCR